MSTEKQPNDGGEDNCIVVRTHCCKRIIYACVNTPEALDAGQLKEIGEMIKEGHFVDHLSANAVRKSGFGCKCKEARKQ